MNKNFHYFAMSYLNDWLDIDCSLFKRLNSQCAQTGREALFGIAKQYRVIRCFRTEYENKVKRLEPAYDRLQKINESDLKKSAIYAVNKLETKLARHYRQKTLSAASKFLWFKFRSPVVIYDSRAVRTLKQKTTDDYKTYYLAWQEKYECYEEKIKQCCDLLPEAKEYVVTDLSEGKICEIVSEPWFRERVFDKFLYYNGA